MAEKAGLATYGKVRSRFGDYPDVIGNLPATLIPKEITTPGKRQIRAFFVSAGNPVLSVPDGDALEAAFEELDLLVSLDFYVTDTSRHADYVLPGDHVPRARGRPGRAAWASSARPFMQVTEAVVPPRGEARQEWRIIDDLSRRIGVAPYSLPPLRLLAAARAAHVAAAPDRRAAAHRPGRRLVRPEALRPVAEEGGALAARHRARRPHRDRTCCGTASATPTAACTSPMPTALGRSTGWSARTAPSPQFPLSLIGLRELRSHNSWMHNSPLLMRGGRTHALRIHPDDAAAAGLADGDVARITSAVRPVEVPVTVTDEMTPGTVALPHGWGHRGGWRLANEAGGVNVNQLAPSDPEGLERLAGMAHLNGIPVRVEAVARAARRIRAGPARLELPACPCRVAAAAVYEAVLFDALGTLVELEPPWPPLRAALAVPHGIEVARGGGEAGDAGRDGLLQGPPHGGPRRRLAGRPSQALRGRAARAAAAGRRARRGRPDRGAPASLRFRPYPDAAPALGRLRQLGIRSAVVSNWDVSLRGVLGEVGLGGLVDEIVVSAEAGAAEARPGDLRGGAAAATLSGRARRCSSATRPRPTSPARRRPGCARC